MHLRSELSVYLKYASKYKTFQAVRCSDSTKDKFLYYLSLKNVIEFLKMKYIISKLF